MTSDFKLNHYYLLELNNGSVLEGECIKETDPISFLYRNKGNSDIIDIPIEDIRICQHLGRLADYISLLDNRIRSKQNA